MYYHILYVHYDSFCACMVLCVLVLRASFRTLSELLMQVFYFCLVSCLLELFVCIDLNAAEETTLYYALSPKMQNKSHHKTDQFCIGY